MFQKRSIVSKIVGTIAICGAVCMPSALFAQSDLQTPEAEAAAANLVFLPIVSANSVVVSQMGVNGGLDPDYVFSAEDLAALAQKNSQAEQHIQAEYQKLAGQVTAAYLQTKTVSLEKQWKEPNDAAHVNYCGPGATQVALDARLAATKVPSIDTLGREEGINPSWGVSMNSVRSVLNTRLNSTWYVLGNASESTQLKNWIKSDVDSSYALITGVNAKGMPGWNLTANVPHIVAVIGYTQQVETSGINFSNVIYSETASATAGYTGVFQQSLGLNTFWSFVKQNNVQTW